MKFARIWVVAGRDLSELRSSRFTLASVVALPLVLSVVVPIAVVLPLASMAGGELPLAIHPVPRSMASGIHASGISVTNISLQASTFENGSIFGSVIGNSTLTDVLVEGSVLRNVTLVHCVVRDSNLYSPRMDAGTPLIDSIVVGQENPLRVFLNQLLNFYLFFFVIIPVAIPSVLASYTIVGEKLNRTLEPVLASPISDTELLLGKSLAILIPSLAATFGSFALFSTLIAGELTRAFGSSPVPNLTWLLTVVLVAPLVCVLSIAVNVLISSRVSDVRLSQQLASLIVLPLIAVFIGGLLGVVTLDPLVIAGLALFLLVIDAGVYALAVRTFHREEILLRWK